MDNSPLKKLPAELLNHIAELALYQEDGVEVQPPESLWTPDGRYLNRAKIPFESAAFTQTCRQLRRDYLPVFWAINTFNVPAPCDRTTRTYNFISENSQSFLLAIGREKAGLLRGFVLDIQLGHCTSGIGSAHPRLSNLNDAIYSVLKQICLVSRVELIFKHFRVAHVKLRFTCFADLHDHEYYLTFNGHNMDESVEGERKRMYEEGKPKEQEGQLEQMRVLGNCETALNRVMQQLSDGHRD